MSYSIPGRTRFQRPSLARLRESGGGRGNTKALEAVPATASSLAVFCACPSAPQASSTANNGLRDFLYQSRLARRTRCILPSTPTRPGPSTSSPTVRPRSGNSGAMASQPPPGIDLSADQGPRIVSSMIALIVLPTIFVIGRLVSRGIARAGFWVSESESSCPKPSPRLTQSNTVG